MSEAGNMYEFVDKKWTPLGGECEHDCSYCSTKSFKDRYEACRLKYSGEYRIDEKELNKNLGCGKFVFVASTMDLFAEGVPAPIIQTILKKCRQHDNTYLLQTKNPKRLFNFKEYFPEKVVLGTTIETDNENLASQVSKAPAPIWRSYHLHFLHYSYDTMVTVEPILEFDLTKLLWFVGRCKPKWVNVGADSKGHNLPEPSPDKVRELLAELGKFTEVRVKDNLKRIIGDG